jgi:hypothetical protein
MWFKTGSPIVSLPHLRFNLFNLCLIALLAFSVHATENRGETRDAFWPTSELAVRHLTDRPVKWELDESPSKQSHGFLPLLKWDYPSVNFASNRDRAPADPPSWTLRDTAFWVGLYDPTAGDRSTPPQHTGYYSTPTIRPAITEAEHASRIGSRAREATELTARRVGYKLGVGLGFEPSKRLKSPPGSTPQVRRSRATATANLFIESEMNAPKNTDAHPRRRTAVGLAGGWEEEPWRVIGEAYLVRTHRNSIQPEGNNSLFGASLQAEYHARDDWALYGRVEKTIGDKDEVEVPFLPHFVKQLLLGGINYPWAATTA